jgi:DNA-binding response OmpR family regulator
MLLIRPGGYPVFTIMKTILIIDDEPDLCALMKKAFAKDDYTVDCACNLLEAAIKLQGHPQVVLLDNNLPDGSGIDYFHSHSAQFIESFVIMISADSSPALEIKAKKEGVDAFIQKPFSVGLLKELIRQVA